MVLVALGALRSTHLQAVVCKSSNMVSMDIVPKFPGKRARPKCPSSSESQALMLMRAHLQRRTLSDLLRQRKGNRGLAKDSAEVRGADGKSMVKLTMESLEICPAVAFEASCDG